MGSYCHTKQSSCEIDRKLLTISLCAKVDRELFVNRIAGTPHAYKKPFSGKISLKSSISMYHMHLCLRSRIMNHSFKSAAAK